MQIVTDIKEQFSDLMFDRFSHTYNIGDEILPSVSSLIKQVSPVFEEGIISAEVARKEGITQEEVLKGWEEIKNEACDRGHRVHDFAEAYTWDMNIAPTCEQEEGVVKFWSEVPTHIVPVFTELKMFHSLYRYAGTLDSLLYNMKSGKFIIVDYKTNKDLFKNYNNQRLSYPHGNRLATPFSKYTLQLSYYQLMLEQVKGVEVERRVLIWLDRTGKYDLYDLEDCTGILEQELLKRN